MNQEIEDAIESYWNAAYNEGKYDLTTDNRKAQNALSRIQSGVCKLEARVAELEAALREAMEWNWLDDDAEDVIPAWIAETIKPKTKA